MSRELTYFSKGDLRWVTRAEPQIVDRRDAIVRPFVVGRCDGDTLPLHHRVSRLMAAGLRAGRIDPAVGHICGPVPFAGPFGIGHEAVAEVVQVGADVTKVAVGDRVVVPWSVSCGTCPSCQRGLTSKCETTRRTATGTASLAAFGFGPASGPYGSLVADLVRVPHADGTLVVMPDSLDPLRAAAASDNLADAWRCVVPYLCALPGADVLVVGGSASSIGLYAAGLAVAHGARRVHYVDADAGRCRIAEALGAEAAHRSPRDRGGARGTYDITVEASSTPHGLEHALRSTAPGGHCTAVGYYVFRRTGVPLMHMYATDITLHLGVSHPRAVLPDMLTWLATHDFAAETVTTTLADFDDAPRVYDATTTKLVLTRDPLRPVLPVPAS